jgi:DNA-binding transcriptional regulator GbsR (MarR family)
MEANTSETDSERVDSPSETEVALDVLAGEHTRRILAAASQQPMSARELADECEASLPTVYRRIDELTAVDFLDSQMQPTDDGNHYRTFETNVERIRVVIAAGSIHTDVKRDGDVVDRFGNLWQDLELDLRG